MSTFKSRPVSSVVNNRETPEGVGVTVMRSIGQNPRQFGPFVLLDQFNLAANSLQKGIGFHPHPHRGMCTFTYILPNDGDQIKDNGSVKHMDHLGNMGIIGPGDIQYMQAGRGIVHSEMPADEKKISGLQLWINLRKEDKMTEPQYQEYTSEQLPVVENGGINAKIIMGTALGTSAKVKTRTPVHYIHYKLKPDTTINHPLPPHWSTFLYIFSGSGVAGSEKNSINAQQTCFFNDGEGAAIALASSDNNPDPVIDQDHGVTITSGAKGLDFVLISGEPLNDGAPVVQHGPVVLNSHQEVMEFMQDYRNQTNGFEGCQKFIRNWRP